MKKNQYIVPSTVIVTLNVSDGLLTTLSGGGVLTSGGNTSDNNINDSDVKGRSDYNVWNDDWSK